MISVILNVYKRPYTINTQIEAILNQSVEVKESDIHIWINTPDVEVGEIDIKYNDVKIYKCNYNTKFWGRFTLPLICRTPYIAMFDDDVVCGKDWLKNCIEQIEKENCILGGSGIIVHSKSYRPNTVVGWNGLKSDKLIEVDLVGHAWFFKQSTTMAMWLETPPSWDNGEDMFFSYAAQKHLGLKTYVPPHYPNDKETWSNVPDRDNRWGFDKNAHSLSAPNHIQLRNQIVGDLIDRDWKTVQNINK